MLSPALFVLSLATPLLVSAFQPFGYPRDSGDGAPIASSDNAAHIFNAIHSSLRQWGSSLNHNGVSFFLAHMPEGTELYHGRGSNEPVNGMEWLAFEPEHALNFAWNMTRGPPAKAPDDPDGPGRAPHRQPPFRGAEKLGPARDHGYQHLSTKWLLHSDPSLMFDFSNLPDIQFPSFHEEVQRPLDDKKPPSRRPPFERNPGYLHTYQAKHDLTLLYIDGMAAGKSDKGTLDSQDYVLQIHSDKSPDETHPFNDFARANYLCQDLSRDRWGGKIHGFIRMEHGFEVILCHFEEDLETIRIFKANTISGPVMGGRGEQETLGFFKAITARYDGIGSQGVGGGRAVLDFESMVTAWQFAAAEDLLEGNIGDEDRLPRLNKVSPAVREAIFSTLDRHILDCPHSRPSHHIDWQAVTDMITARYSDRLHSLAYSSNFATKDELDFEIHLLLRPFIDHDVRNATAEIERCATHFFPKTYPPSLAAESVLNVSYAMCSVLSAASEVPSSTPFAFEIARMMFRELVTHLQWTTWKKCRGCAYDEICLTAIWPFGSEEDHLRPTCKNGSQIAQSRGYWGGFGGPGRGRNDSHGRV